VIARRSLLVAPVVLAAAACGGAPAPAMVNLTVRASSNLNESRAVAVRLYSLSAKARFGTADAYALMDRDRAVLGEDGSRVEEFVIRPGETRNITIAPKADARFIGVVVLFQDIDRSRWRDVAPIAPSGLTKLVLALGSNAATLEGV
jgi:type VI secretion system protein VasD